LLRGEQKGQNPLREVLANRTCDFGGWSAKVQSKFIEQQSHKHDGNIFLNTHQGLTANEVLGNNR
jgi:hypothetical protein